MNEAQIHRYARHISLGAIGYRGQSELLESSVVVEAGGDPASHCAIVYLAASGVGRLALRGADSPVTDIEVKQSLIFTAADVGVSRLDSFRTRLASLNTDVDVCAAKAEASVAFEIERATNLAKGLELGCAAAAAWIAWRASTSTTSKDRR